MLLMWRQHQQQRRWQGTYPAPLAMPHPALPASCKPLAFQLAALHQPLIFVGLAVH